ncbi:MAG TPA: NAD(P)-binding domain-containing protein, partial [Thermoanaerobaculia bacterium]|nr:NAD(P)-binding domain-containing protein [Thermoanaerobaculia bacterium]
MSRRLAVIGAGKMGGTLLKALLGSGTLAAGEVIATVKHAEGAAELASRLGIATSTDNREAVAGAEVVLLAVKPQALGEVVSELAPVLAEGQLLVSSVAAAATPFIEERL